MDQRKWSYFFVSLLFVFSLHYCLLLYLVLIISCIAHRICSPSPFSFLQLLPSPKSFLKSLMVLISLEITAALLPIPSFKLYHSLLFVTFDFIWFSSFLVDIYKINEHQPCQHAFSFYNIFHEILSLIVLNLVLSQISGHHQNTQQFVGRLLFKFFLQHSRILQPQLQIIPHFSCDLITIT